MERVNINRREAQFSSRFFARFRPDNSQTTPPESSPKTQKEPEPPYRQIINRRSGNLSSTTKLNKPVADEFMERTDMRRWIIVEDSDKLSEASAVAVGSDVLAWRAIKPFNELFAQTFKSQPLHTLVRKDGDPKENNHWLILTHERIIDQKVRDKSPADRSEYGKQFLQLLNKAVKSGLAEALFREKLGPDQALTYGGYFLWGSALSVGLLNNGSEAFLPWALHFYEINVSVNLCSGILRLMQNVIPQPLRGEDMRQLYFMRSNLKEAWLPLLPIDKWVLGRLYLAHHGNNFIIPKE